MRIEFLAAAEAELADAISYYNDQSEGLGYRFAGEVKETLGRIVRFPDAWPSLSRRTRRCRTRRFPYAVVYQVRSESILVVAIMHMRRHPDSWASRLRGGER